MESLSAIGVGLVLRLVLDVATDNDDRVSGVLLGLWEGVVLNHFIRRMPRSFDPYLGFGFRIFVDFLFTQSLSRLALVVLWALVGMLLSDVAPNVWHDSGLRHLYRQVRKDVRHVKRAVPRIRIKNDLPSVRLFEHSRSASRSEASGSIRSDRAAPSRSPAPTPAPTPGPSRRPGRSPPGTFPDISGWSETATDVSVLRERVVISPGPSPALIPSREHAAYARVEATTHVSTSQVRATSVRETAITITQTQNESVLLETTKAAASVAAAASTSLGLIDDLSRHDPPTIPDDWVDVSCPAPAQSNEPVPPFRPDPDSTPESQPGLSTHAQSRPASVFEPPPAIEVLLDIPDVDHGNKASQLPEQIPLPESRAASVIGGVFDQPQPRSALRESHRSRVDKATSELGVAPTKSFAATQSTTKTQSTSRSWFGGSGSGSKLKQSVDVGAPQVSPKETQRETVEQGKLDVGSAVQNPESQLPTPAQVDAPTSILSQPGDVSPLLLKPSALEPEPKEEPEPLLISKPGLSPTDDAGVDTSPASLQGGVDKGDTAGPSKSPFDVPSPPRTPPPPFTEFAGVSEGLAAGEAPVEQDPVAGDEAQNTLTDEQKAAEEKRLAFLMTQVQELEGSRNDLRRKLDKQDDVMSRPAKMLEDDIEDAEKSLSDIKARIAKTKFSEPPSNPPVREVILINKSATEGQFAVTSTLMKVLLQRDDAGPMTIQVMISKGKPLSKKAKEMRDAIQSLAKRHQFTPRFESATPGIVNITF